jgi:hypothetical protein
MHDPEDQLTELQRVILEIDQLGLPLRDAVRQVNIRVGFFVGQQRYLEEVRKIRQKVAPPGGPAA